MKKILLLLLISISGYSQTLLKLKAIEYAPGAGYCVITNSLGVQTYTPCSSLSSTVVPTLQQVLTAGNTSTTTGINLIDANFRSYGLGASYETSFDAGYGNFKDFNGNQLFEIDGVGIYDASDLWVRIYGKKVVTVNSTDTLSNKTVLTPTIVTSTKLDYATANRLTYTDGSKLLKSVTLVGATLSSGTLTIPTQTTGLASLTGTETLTNKRITARTTTITTAATITPTSDNTDLYAITTLSTATTFTTPSGTPTEGQSLIIRVKDNGIARALTFSSIYSFSSDMPAPTTTVLSKTMYLAFIYNLIDTKWDCVGLINNF